MKRILYHPVVRKHVSQGLKFAICGGLGASVDLGSLTALVEVLEVNPHAGYVISTLLAVTIVFLGNKFFTFRNHEKKYASEIFKFVLVYGCAVIFNVGLSSLFFLGGMHYILAKILAIGIVALWNYCLSHRFIFKKSEEIDVDVV